jgi:hypothetical protein
MDLYIPICLVYMQIIKMNNDLVKLIDNVIDNCTPS